MFALCGVAPLLRVHRLVLSSEQIACSSRIMGFILTGTTRQHSCFWKWLEIKAFQMLSCQFIQPSGSPATEVMNFSLPHFCLPWLPAVAHYLRQNLLIFLHVPKYTDSNTAHHFKVASRLIFGSILNIMCYIQHTIYIQYSVVGLQLCLIFGFFALLYL